MHEITVTSTISGKRYVCDTSETHRARRCTRDSYKTRQELEKVVPLLESNKRQKEVRKGTEKEKQK
jgi:hypothetical protein